LSGFENLIGSDFDDHLTGNDESNVIRGLSGEDEIFGLGGDDFIYGGGAGNGSPAETDQADGGEGSDLCQGVEQATNCET
jgi:Ca2+-binding RTX toxin-like protein